MPQTFQTFFRPIFFGLFSLLAAIAGLLVDFVSLAVGCVLALVFQLFEENVAMPYSAVRPATKA